MIRIAIPSYNRPAMCEATVKDILLEGHADIHVYLDGGCEYEWTNPLVTFHKLDKPPGREHYWKVWNRILADARDSEWDYFLALPDDFTPAVRFPIRQAVALMWAYPEIDALVPVVDKRGRGPCWVAVDPVRHGSVLWRTGWIDGCFICHRNFLQELNWELPAMSPNHFNTNQSSGVGKWMSLMANDRKQGIYQVDKTLYRHGGHESVMHKEFRKENPL